MQFVKNHLKNISGWKTKRKLVLFAVDDYGNIRLKDKNARDKLIASGIKLNGSFDMFDSIETRLDLEMLYEALSSVKDLNGNFAKFSTYSLPCNIDFDESMKARQYVFENLVKTYYKLESENPKIYENTYNLLKEGISQGLISPQFHGREHLNVFIINELFKIGDVSLEMNLLNSSMAGINRVKKYPNIKFSQAFAYQSFLDTLEYESIITSGIVEFEKVYGSKPITFTAPSQVYFPQKYILLEKQGILGINKGLNIKRLDEKGRSFYERSRLGIEKNQNHISIVRNVVFEPAGNRNIDWVQFAINQIDAAFFWNKPAIISSHRVNFCGNISEENRKVGVNELSKLLNRIVEKYPDVEFINMDELCTIIEGVDK